ncbi:hypothetical protein Tco_0071410 [Tanacetum coccineum]
MDREFKRLKRSRIPLVKVRWNSRRGPKFTWEREDQFRKKYPHLFTKTAPSISVSIRCQGYISDLVLGCHAKDMVALCFGKLINTPRTLIPLRPNLGVLHVPTAVATKSGQVPVNAAKQSSPRAATSISSARTVNTAALKQKTWISQVACAKEPRTSFDELMDTSSDFSAFVLNRLNIKDMTQEILARPVFELLKGTCKSLTELEYHLKECSKASTERLERYKTLRQTVIVPSQHTISLIRDHRGCQVIPQDFFINNDLKYLKDKDLSRWYSTSVMKTKANTYEIKWIEDLGPKRQHFYGFTANMSSSNDVYSRKIIIVVTRLMIMKKYDYDYLEEIEVRREDQKLYKFREGDFPRLRLQDIEDMLLLLVQHKLTNFTIDKRYALNVVLRMFIRWIVIQRRMEDLQLDVESYQKKLNLTKPYTFRLNLRNRTTYTAYSDPKGVIYKDQMNKNRLMCANEIHKFGDGTLNDVRSALNDIAKGIRMEYLPKRK